MDNKYYSFDSKGYLVTLAAVPKIFRDAINNQDFSEDGGKNIIKQLIWNEYPSSVSFPIVFYIEDGKKVRNIVEMRHTSAFLIFKEIKELFESNGITGWKPYDIILYRKDGSIMEGYYGFTVTGTNSIDPNNPDYIPDFFHFYPKYGYIVCTQRVVDLLKKHKIKDFEIMEINEQNCPHLIECIVFPK